MAATRESRELIFLFFATTSLKKDTGITGHAPSPRDVRRTRRLLGRMNASVRFCVWGVMPIGALLAGALGTWLGVVPTMWIGAAGQLLAAAFVVIGPFWRMRQLPDAEPASGAGS